MTITFGFGVGFDKAGDSIRDLDAQIACRLITDRAVQLFGGCALLSGDGAWKPKLQPAIYEPARILVIHVAAENGSTRGKISALANYIKGTLDQESVLVTIQQSDLLFF